jgi:hypothetical protein
MVVKKTRSALVVLLVGLLTVYASLSYASHSNLSNQSCLSKEQYADQIQALNPGISIATLTPEDLAIFESNYNAAPPPSDFNITGVVIGVVINAPVVVVAIAVDGCVKIQEGFPREFLHKMLTKAEST